MDGNQLGLKTIFLGMVFNKTPIKMVIFIRKMVRLLSVRLDEAASILLYESTASMSGSSPESLMVSLWLCQHSCRKSPSLIGKSTIKVPFSIANC